jgi:hypothetical protein
MVGGRTGEKPFFPDSRRIRLIEVIHSDKIHTYTTALEAERHLSLYPATIRLDLHGVLDILPKDVQLAENRIYNKIVCISFVGPNTRNDAIKDIKERILYKQIDYGVLVFNRGRGKEKFTYVEEGSKAWVNKFIPFNGNCIFIDDSTDHLRSTQYLLPDISCVLFNTGIPNHLTNALHTWEQQYGHLGAIRFTQWDQISPSSLDQCI